MSQHPDRAYNDTDTEQEQHSFVSIKQVMRGFYSSLFVDGYNIQARAGGHFANHDVYYKETLKIGEANGVQIHRLLEGQGAEMGRFENAVDRWAGRAYQESSGKTESKLIASIYEGFTSASSNKNNKACGYGLRFSPNLEKPRSCTGKLAYSQIPSLSWFPHLKALKPERMLALFPEVEAQLMMLTIGKALWGNQNVKLMEGTCKSVIMKHLVSGFKYLGYTTDLIADGVTKFGWGEVARADIAWREDMTDNVQKSLLESSELKSIITGGDISSQRKGENAVSVQSTATLFFCTNSAGKHLFKDMDAGSLDRFKFLDTYNLDEQAAMEKEEGFSRNTYHNWVELSKQYKVTSLELAVYLMAHCADRFLKACCKKIEDGQIVDHGKDTLKEVTDSLSSKLGIQTNLAYLKDAVYSVSHLVALAIASKENVTPEGKAKVTDVAEKSAFGHVMLQQALYAYVATGGTSDEPFIMKLQYDCYSAMATQIDRRAHEMSRLHANQAFNAMVSELISEDGYKFSPTVAYYANDWKEARKGLRRLVKQYGSYDMKAINNNRALKTVLATIWNILEKTA
jgi:hypothetical protein